VKIAPEYEAPVIHAKDASETVRILGVLRQPGKREAWLDALRQQQSRQREISREQQIKKVYVSLAEARKNKLV
jgi:5-methyltetrahydrofolate--homocysteine methyltransferase